MRRSLSFVALAFATAALGACGGDADRESGLVELSFELRSADADGDGTVTAVVALASLPGDPWAAFVASARDRFGGDPSSLAVEDVRLRLETEASNVADLADVFHGPVGLDLRIDANNNRYDVAEGLLDDDQLGVEAALSPRLRWSDVADDDRAAALDGGASAFFVGQAGTSFRDGGATATLAIEATFVATP